MGYGGMRVEALTEKHTGLLWGELASLICAGQSNEGFFGLVWGREV